MRNIRRNLTNITLSAMDYKRLLIAAAADNYAEFSKIFDNKLLRKINVKALEMKADKTSCENYLLGSYYEMRDIELAHGYYKKSAEQGNHDAYYELANLELYLLNIHGLEPAHIFESEAFEKYEKAARMEHYGAMCIVADIYWEMGLYKNALQYIKKVHKLGDIGKVRLWNAETREKILTLYREVDEKVTEMRKCVRDCRKF